MDIATYVRAIDALIARGEPITTQNLNETADEIHRAAQNGKAPPPSLPGQDFRIQLHAFGANEGAHDSDWDAYVQALDSQGYNIRWSSTSPAQLSGPVDDDGTGYSHAAYGPGPYALLDHQPPPAPSQQPHQPGLGEELRDVLTRAKDALYRGATAQRAHRTQERRDGTTTDDGPAQEGETR